MNLYSTKVLALLAAGMTAACDATIDTPEEIVEASIERHGGDMFDNVTISWDFRGIPFRVTRDGGVFQHQRTVTDSLGTTVIEVMDNQGTWVEVAGERQAVSDEREGQIAMGVNSTVYLGFLPYRLDDPAVQLADLGSTMVEGQAYRKVEVTFAPEGGGSGWENRFVYWFSEGDWTLDYLAYSEPLDPPVTRFRRAVNRRAVNGLLIQDYENYTADPQIEDIANYDEFFERGELRLLSMVEFDSVEVEVHSR
jgi:hypothetical protein